MLTECSAGDTERKSQCAGIISGTGQKHCVVSCCAQVGYRVAGGSLIGNGVIRSERKFFSLISQGSGADPGFKSSCVVHRSWYSY